MNKSMVAGIVVGGAAVLSVGVLLLGLAACSGDPDGDEGEAAGTTSTSSAASTRSRSTS